MVCGMFLSTSFCWRLARSFSVVLCVRSTVQTSRWVTHTSKHTHAALSTSGLRQSHPKFIEQALAHSQNTRCVSLRFHAPSSCRLQAIQHTGKLCGVHERIHALPPAPRI
eukprot:SAG25_NODE_190_length_12277_cov_10.004927_9_plen_110_part_00